MIGKLRRLYAWILHVCDLDAPVFCRVCNERIEQCGCEELDRCFDRVP